MVGNLYHIASEFLVIKITKRNLRRTFQISRKKRSSIFSLNVKDAGFVIVLLELKILKIKKAKFDPVEMPPHRKHATPIVIINRFTHKNL